MRRHGATVAACALALLGGCGGDADPVITTIETAGMIDAYTPYWVGASFEGLAMRLGDAHSRETNAIYGTCKASGDAGCAAPLTIQTTSICDRNPLVLDLRSRVRRRVRGVRVREYAEGDRSLEIGDANVTVFATSLPIDKVLAALRPLDRDRRATRLPRARYPRAYVRELRRVRDAYVRLGNVRAVRGELHISKSSVRFRLALARELGHRRLRRPDADFEFNGRCALEPSP